MDKKAFLVILILAALGMTGCAQVTESMNGAGRSIEGFFSR